MRMRLQVKEARAELPNVASEFKLFLLIAGAITVSWAAFLVYAFAFILSLALSITE